MARPRFSFTGEVWEHEGPAAWYFVSLPEAVADEIEATYGHRAAGFGSLRVEVTIGKTRWATSVFPDRKRGTYVLPLRKEVRVAEQLVAGSPAEGQPRRSRQIGPASSSLTMRIGYTPLPEKGLRRRPNMCTTVSMLADLAAVLKDLDIRPDGDSLVGAIALRDRLDARIAEVTGVFEANGCWAGRRLGFLRCLAARHAKMTRRSAQRLRTLAVRLRSLPLCAQAYAEGTLSGGQIEAIMARLDDDVVEIFAAQETELVPYLSL